MRYYAELEDGSLINHKGRLLFVSTERFAAQILQGENCFICGAMCAEKTFNDEHVLPQWILRRFGLHGYEITLPNRTRIKYVHYTVPCCEECNSRMGEVLEEPVRQILAGGLTAVGEHLKTAGPWLILSWMALLFFKTHYKDAFLLWDRDRRKPEHRIGEIYDWSDLHHVYCLARAFYSGAVFDESALTSLFVIPARPLESSPQFDFADHFDSKGMMVRLGDMAIVAFLDDGCAVLNLARETMAKIRAPLAPIQIREVFSRLVYHRMLVEACPEYGTQVDATTGTVRIIGEPPSTISSRVGDEKEFGSLMEFFCTGDLEHYPAAEKREVLERIRTGRATFLEDEEGAFMPVDWPM